jgi:AcrR family transcriptional regulator
VVSRAPRCRGVASAIWEDRLDADPESHGDAAISRSGLNTMSPRPNASADEILDATVELIAEHGISGLTVDTVAVKTGVSKATIYRRWRSRAALIRDAIAGLHRPIADPDTGSLRGDLIILIKDLVDFLNRPGGGRVDASFLEASARDPELAALRRETAREARSAYERSIARAIERGEVPPDVDVRLFTDMVISPFLYRRLVDHSRARPADIEPVIDAALAAFSRVRT